MSYEAYLDVIYSFTGNEKEDYEGRKEKLGTCWNLKPKMLTKKISVTDKSLNIFILPLRPTTLSGKSIQK